jgi:hypothetical protein
MDFSLQDVKEVEICGSYTPLCPLFVCLNIVSAVFTFMKFGVVSNQYRKQLHFTVLYLVMPHDGRMNIWRGNTSGAPVRE